MNSAFYEFVGQNLSRNDPAPLYQQLDKAIRASIDQGILNPNDYLPSERTLMQELQVSRKTVRNALERLRADKVIDSTRGQGTVVTRKINYAIKDEKGFSEVVARLGGTPSTRWLTREKIAASTDIADKLGLAQGEPVYQLKRLRLIDGMPVSIENSYVRGDAIHDVESIENSLYRFFQDNGIQIGRKTSYISAAMPSQETAELLHLDDICPILIVRQLIFRECTQTPLEYCINYCRSDAYEFIFED